MEAQRRENDTYEHEVEDRNIPGIASKVFDLNGKPGHKKSNYVACTKEK